MLYNAQNIHVLFKTAECKSSSQVKSFLIRFFSHKSFMSTDLATKTISIGWVIVDRTLFLRFFLYKDGAIINLGFVFFNSATMVFEKKIGSEILNFGSFSRIVVKELKRMCVIRLRTNRKVPYTVVWRGLHIN